MVVTLTIAVFSGGLMYPIIHGGRGMLWSSVNAS
jgi:hypothetical protein